MLQVHIPTPSGTIFYNVETQDRVTAIMVAAQYAWKQHSVVLCRPIVETVSVTGSAS